jgi:pimeloyl-ACP methyl ester carboxylesterase
MSANSLLDRALAGVRSLWPLQCGEDNQCDQTGIKRTDYRLQFQVPEGLMPDNQFDSQPASLRVHRVSPTYSRSGCRAKKAMILVHGRTLGGSVHFDLQHTTPGFAPLSLQEALAYGGIDTFAPDLLGYGLSTRFSLDDPANASLPGYQADGSCSVIGCDRTRNPAVFPLDQQKTKLGTHPLNGAYKTHSSKTYFGNTDVWARDIRQVIDDARSKTGLRKVSLLGYSFGGPRVGRVLHQLGPSAAHHIDRVIFVSSLFDTLLGPGGDIHVEYPTEEKDLPAVEKSTSFPLMLTAVGGWDNPSPERVPPGAPEAYGEQALLLDPIGAKWGGTDPSRPTGLIRSPTFTNSGWNKHVAKAITIPTLVLHGTDDKTVPATNAINLYPTLTVPKKVLVEINCASHLMQYETAPTWEGPHRAVADAIIDWVHTCTFDSRSKGHFRIDCQGRVREETT